MYITMEHLPTIFLKRINRLFDVLRSSTDALLIGVVCALVFCAAIVVVGAVLYFKRVKQRKGIGPYNRADEQRFV